jgi:Bacterial conjugation TrbI-like protein
MIPSLCTSAPADTLPASAASSRLGDCEPRSRIARLDARRDNDAVGESAQSITMLPTRITAQVTEAVYDSPTGKYLLIPQGAKLIGQYDSSVAFGQSRVLLVWTRIIMPDGSSIVLERQPGADTQGYAGLEDEVDNHWGMLVKAAVLSTLLSVGAKAGTSQDENSLVQAIRSGASNSISQTGQQIVQRQLNNQPTLTIRPGFPVRVIVTHNLVLAPYGQGGRPSLSSSSGRSPMRSRSRSHSNCQRVFIGIWSPTPRSSAAQPDRPCLTPPS